MNGHVLAFFDILVRASSFSFFGPHRRYKISRGTPSAGALNTRGWVNFANVVLYLGHGTWPMVSAVSLWNTNRK